MHSEIETLSLSPFFFSFPVLNVFSSCKPKSLEGQPTVGFSLYPHGTIMPLFRLNTSENQKISLPLSFLSLSPSLLSYLSYCPHG